MIPFDGGSVGRDGASDVSSLEPDINGDGDMSIGDAHCGSMSSSSGMRPHRCTLCEKSFARPDTLATHISGVHRKKRPHACSHCDKRFSSKGHVKTHISSVHKKERLNQCPRCEKSFSQKSNLNSHMKSVHESRRTHTCSECEKTFSTKTHLRLHVASVHEKRQPFKCSMCDKSFSQKANLRGHVANVHEKKRPHKCEQCEKGFARKTHLKRHVSLVHDATRPPDLSKKTLQLPQHAFVDFEDVQDNVLTHSTSPTAHASIMSSGCFQGSVSEDITYDGYARGVEPPPSVFFMTHPSSDGVLFPFSIYPRSLSGGAPIKIMTIDASILLSGRFELFYVGSTPTQFGQEFMRTYQSHVLVVGRDDEQNLALAREHFTLIDMRDNALLCFEANQARIATRVRVDGKSYPNAVMLGFCNRLRFQPEDVRTFDGTKVSWSDGTVGCPFEQCTYRNASWVYLKDHYRAMHLKMSSFECHLCNRSFSWPGYLKRHIACVHDKKRPHQCAQCEKTFSAKSDLRRHIAHVHDEERQHKCSRCDKSFTQSSHLKHHVASVHDKKRPHQCEQCDKSFSRKGTLKAHIAKIHGVKP